MKRAIISLTALAISSLGFATDLVTNGTFESSPLGTGWTEASAGNFQIIGDWSNSIVDSNSDLGPATNTAWLGGYDLADDSITQSISTQTGLVSAFLDFDFYYTDEDIPTFDLFTVSLGGSQVYSFDPGGNATGTLSGVQHQHIDVLSLMDGSAKNLVFRITTDDSLASSVFVDNVTLNVTASTVPEPATMAALGLGIAALVRRRKKN